MRYTRYGIRDFVKDPFFQRWVLTRDAETETFWRAWLLENPDKQFVVEEARRIIHLLNFSTDPEANDRLLQTWQALDVKGVHHAPAQHKTNDVHHPHWFKIAAALALLIISGFTLWYVQARTVTIRTAFSELRSVTLPDGSVVDLNANSSIQYPKNWNSEDPREVWLEGEAFFSVQHNSKNKFVVHTAKGIDVNVLGTTFNVMTRRNTTRVSLNTGKIQVHLGAKFLPDDSTGEEEFIMLPGEVAEFNLETSMITKHAAEVERYASWKDRQMIFDNTAMDDVALMLQDTHGLKVYLDEPLRMRRITGAFQSDDIDILIQFIAKALNAAVRRDANEIHFESKNSEQ